jgi:hypothetical protein
VAWSVFFERELQRPQRLVQRADAGLQAELGVHAVQGQVVILGDGGADRGLVALVERLFLDDLGPGGDLAGGLVAADETAGPFGADGGLAAEFGEAEAFGVVGQDAGAHVEREGLRHDGPPGKPTIMTRPGRKRTTDSQVSKAMGVKPTQKRQCPLWLAAKHNPALRCLANRTAHMALLTCETVEKTEVL